MGEKLPGTVVKLKLLNILLSDMRIFRSFNRGTWLPGYEMRGHCTENTIITWNV